MTKTEPFSIARRLSDAYWPSSKGNCSAHVEDGNAAVDALTLGELRQFYVECSAGPTYCMVTRRVQEVLKDFPPQIENKRERAVAALEAAKYAFLTLANAVESVK